jgi:hypothetical protein
VEDRQGGARAPPPSQSAPAARQIHWLAGGRRPGRERESMSGRF